MMRTAGMLALLGAVGCAPEPLPISDVEAPTFILANFDEEEPDLMRQAIEQELVDFALTRLDAVTDPSQEQSDEWLLEIPNLTQADLGELEVPEGASLDEIKFPLLRVRRSAFSVAEHRAVALEPNRICLDSETTEWAERTFTEGEDCFADGSCERLRAVQETYKRNPLTAIWYDQQWDLRSFPVDWVDADGREEVEALVTRAWLDERFFSESGGNSWDQIWSIDILVDDPDGGSVGVNAYWTSLQVTLLTDSLLQNSLREGLHQSANWTEHWLETGGEPDPDCPTPRDEEKPERWENVGNE